LRQNVTWHDGTPFTSRDVTFTLGLWANPAVPFFLRNNFRLIASVEATDDHTVVVTMGDLING
jgi:peptide/nickel transport system substrate-binding protein